MKKKKLLITLISIFTVIALIFGAFFIYAGIHYSSKDFDSSSYNTSLVKEKHWTEYQSNDKSNTYGFIFYQGAKVDDEAYSPLGYLLSDDDINVYICDLPFNLAFFGMNYATEVIKANPQIEHWYVGGHSLGGAMISSWASKNYDKIDGVVLLGSYATKEIKGGVKGLSLYGSNDKVVNRENLAKSENYFSTFEEFEIEGGNHAYFGNYGEQKGDGKATITPLEQWTITVEHIASFIK